MASWGVLIFMLMHECGRFLYEKLQHLTSLGSISKTSFRPFLCAHIYTASLAATDLLGMPFYGTLLRQLNISLIHHLSARCGTHCHLSSLRIPGCSVRLHLRKRSASLMITRATWCQAESFRRGAGSAGENYLVLAQ